MKLPERLLRISQAFREAGYQLYVVGGAVRDAVRGSEPKDFDLATNATPEQVTQVILRMLSGWEADLTGEAFGVVRARMCAAMQEIKELYEYEIATFREDMSAGRHPTVRFATIREDVMRRDLTINALFYDIEAREVVDYVGGLHDLEIGIVHTVGRPEDRFAEDRLRILRAVRFATRFGYAIHVATEEAIMRDNNLNDVSLERIRDEFVRTVATAQSVTHALQLYRHLGLWERVFPGLKVNVRPGLTSRSVPVLLSQLLEGNDPERVACRLNELRYTDLEVRQVLFFMRFRGLGIDNAFKLRKLYQQGQIARSQVGEYLAERGQPSIRLALAFADYLDLPPVRGDELLAQGYSGRGLGVELERRENELFRGLVGT
jgi:tRNA nucleotidyltransferase/poly(A) polymerase